MLLAAHHRDVAFPVFQDQNLIGTILVYLRGVCLVLHRRNFDRGSGDGFSVFGQGATNFASGDDCGRETRKSDEREEE